VNLTPWVCGLEVLCRCAVQRLASRTNRLRVQLGRYKVCVSDEGTEEFFCRNFVTPKLHVDGAPVVVEFTSRFEQAPPPHPLLLALHATLARVAYMFGAAGFFDRLQCRTCGPRKKMEWDGRGRGCDGIRAKGYVALRQWRPDYPCGTHPSLSLTRCQWSRFHNPLIALPSQTCSHSKRRAVSDERRLGIRPRCMREQPWHVGICNNVGETMSYRVVYEWYMSMQ